MTVRLYVLLILVGLALLTVAAVYWVMTGIQSVLFVMAGLCIIALGAIRGMEDDKTQDRGDEEH